MPFEVDMGCSVWLCVAVCCNVLQCVAVYGRMPMQVWLLKSQLPSHCKLNSELTFENLVCWCSNDPIQGVVLEKWKFSKVSSTVTLYSKKTCRLTFEKFICWYSDNGNQGVLLEEARTRKCHEQERLSTNLFGGTEEINKNFSKSPSETS